MITIDREQYKLCLSHDPCEIFQYFNVDEMHGLNLNDCKNHHNTKENAYIAGWCNFIPKQSNDYHPDDPYFVYINLERCKDEKTTLLILFHEMMHLSLKMYKWNQEFEEEIISYAENETDHVFEIIKQYIK